MVLRSSSFPCCDWLNSKTLPGKWNHVREAAKIPVELYMCWSSKVLDRIALVRVIFFVVLPITFLIDWEHNRCKSGSFKELLQVTFENVLPVSSKRKYVHFLQHNRFAISAWRTSLVMITPPYFDRVPLTIALLSGSGSSNSTLNLLQQSPYSPDAISQTVAARATKHNEQTSHQGLRNKKKKKEFEIAYPHLIYAQQDNQRTSKQTVFYNKK